MRPRIRPRPFPQVGLAFVLAALAPGARAQPPALQSHEVHPDGSVTLRLFAPEATAVTVGVDYDRPLPMEKGSDGVWSYTTPALVAALHMYGFSRDGVAILDPLNPAIDPCLRLLTNEVTVPGAPQIWDLADVPHGVVHRHLYHTSILQGLEAGIERYYVYTPPGYDAAESRRYPVLYLLHGWTHVAESWMQCGQANLILDNLAARGRLTPMIVVMPLNYGAMDFVLGPDQWDDPSKVARNLELFQSALLREIIPQVEALYRVSSRRADRAIAGLSMGGGQSLVIGLNNPDTFGWVAGFSAAVGYPDYEAVFSRMDPRKAPAVLWVSCATGDGGYPNTQRFEAWLRKKGMDPLTVEGPGVHNWAVWRDNLSGFAPLLFKAADTHAPR